VCVCVRAAVVGGCESGPQLSGSWCVYVSLLYTLLSPLAARASGAESILHPARAHTHTHSYECTHMHRCTHSQTPEYEKGFLNCSIFSVKRLREYALLSGMVSRQGTRCVCADVCVRESYIHSPLTALSPFSVEAVD